MKIIKKITISLLIIIITLAIYNFPVKAFSVSDFTGEKSTINVGEIQNASGKILSVVTLIGSVISVIILVVLGIKYMLGSIEEKANYKRTLMPYVIGVFCVFAASTITGILYQVFSNIK